MEKNYYEILEVDKKASQEIIKKAYSTLAKKYHPDLQPDSQKNIAEEKFKLVNEAYETLSNDELRKQYDSSLNNNFVPKELYDSLYEENQKLKNIINKINVSNSQASNQTKNYNQAKTTYQNYQQPMYTYYRNPNPNYTNFSSPRYDDNYKIKKTPKDYFKNILSILITVIIVIIIWNTPIVKSIINLIFSAF